MSWTDKEALRTINKLRDEFGISDFIETGTYKGVNADIQSKNFNRVFTCEINPDYYIQANLRLKDRENVYIEKMDSPSFLRRIMNKLPKKTIKFIYLDAHFYDPNLPKEQRFVVLRELRALAKNNKCIICIHDFDNGKFGHITYDGQPLDFNLLQYELRDINPDFYYYTNTECDIVKSGKEIGLEDDDEMESTLKFVWSSPEKTKRGILYCIPKKLDLKKYKLRKINAIEFER